MPGKVNPTQSEAMIMVCIQVYGNDAAVAIAGAGATSSSTCASRSSSTTCCTRSAADRRLPGFREFCVEGLEPDYEQIRQHLENSLMLVTALNPIIGYDKAAEVAKKAHKESNSQRIHVAASLTSGSTHRLPGWYRTMAWGLSLRSFRSTTLDV
jgi:fumarate hydratase class II